MKYIKQTWDHMGLIFFFLSLGASPFIYKAGLLGLDYGFWLAACLGLWIAEVRERETTLTRQAIDGYYNAVKRAADSTFAAAERNERDYQNIKDLLTEGTPMAIAFEKVFKEASVQMIRSQFFHREMLAKVNEIEAHVPA